MGITSRDASRDDRRQPLGPHLERLALLAGEIVLDIRLQRGARLGRGDVVHHGADRDRRDGHHREMGADGAPQVMRCPIADRQTRPRSLQGVTELDRVERGKQAAIDGAAPSLGDDLERHLGERHAMLAAVLCLARRDGPNGLRGVELVLVHGADFADALPRHERQFQSEFDGLRQDRERRPNLRDLLLG